LARLLTIPQGDLKKKKRLFPLPSGEKMGKLKARLKDSQKAAIEAENVQRRCSKKKGKERQSKLAVWGEAGRKTQKRK